MCNSQPKICNSVNFFFTHAHKMPIQRATRAPAAPCVCVCVCYTSVATLVVPGLCPFCPPHCQASARRANRNAHWFFARFLTVQNLLFRTLSTHNNSSQTSSWHGASTHRHSGSPSRRSFDVSRAYLRNRTLSSASAAAHSTFRRRQNAVGHHRESFAHAQ